MLNPSRSGRLDRLEAVRGAAAAGILLQHSGFRFDGILGVPFLLGQEAVILFFLLSGFVIYYATLGKVGVRPSFGSYFVRRFRRIYPLLCVSLVLAYAVQCALAGRMLSIEPARLAGNLLMLQDSSQLKRGVWVDTYYDNGPLWSLSYEWWFYMLFFPIGVGISIRPALQKYVVAALSLAGYVLYQFYPNAPALFLGYFFIWWSGVELAREYSSSGRITWAAQLPSLFLLAALAACWSIPVVWAISRRVPISPGIDPVLQFRHFTAALGFLVIGIAWYKARFKGFGTTLAPLAVVAPITFAFYILHGPVLSLSRHFLSAYPPIVQLATALAVLVPACYFLEVILQKRVNREFDRLQGFFSRRIGSTSPALAND